MIGLIDSSEPSRAWAPPMRPPFLRLSSVSSAPNTWVRRGEVLDQGDHLVGRRAAGGGLGGEQHLGAEAGGDRARVDDAHVEVALDGLGARSGPTASWPTGRTRG